MDGRFNLILFGNAWINPYLLVLVLIISNLRRGSDFVFRRDSLHGLVIHGLFNRSQGFLVDLYSKRRLSIDIEETLYIVSQRHIRKQKGSQGEAMHGGFPPKTGLFFLFTRYSRPEGLCSPGKVTFLTRVVTSRACLLLPHSQGGWRSFPWYGWRSSCGIRLGFFLVVLYNL